MRIAILLSFAGVYGSIAIPMCVGVPLVGSTEGPILWSVQMPTADDHRKAAELEAQAAASGVTLDVSPIEITQARRLGRLGEVEQMADAVFPARGQGARAHAEGAYYPEEDVRTERRGPVDFPWGWAMVVFGMVFASVGAFAAAVFSLMGSKDEEEPEFYEPPFGE